MANLWAAFEAVGDDGNCDNGLSLVSRSAVGNLGSRVFNLDLLLLKGQIQSETI